MFFIKTQAQVNESLIGDWTKVKVKALDGSRDLSARFSMSNYYNWQISPTEIRIRTDAAYAKGNTSFEYKRAGDLINTSSDEGYKIDKLTGDSLVVVENLKGKTEKDKIQKTWFVRTSKITNEYKEKFKNDSVLWATPLFTPTLKKDFMVEVANNFRKRNSFTNLIFKGNLIINPKKRTVKFETDDQKINTDKNFQTIKGEAENSFSDWNLNNFENFDNIYIPYVVESKVINSSDGIKISYVRIYFFIKNPSDIEKLSGPKMQDLEKAQKIMKKAVVYLHNKNYDMAVEYFNKGYDLDPTKVDALYNIVSIYSFLKDKPKMCKTLKKLRDLEQTDGTKLYDDFCVLSL